MNETNLKIGERLKYLRVVYLKETLNKDITQKDLALLLGLNDYQQYQKYEYGRLKIPATVLNKLIDHFKLPPNFFLVEDINLISNAQAISPLHDERNEIPPVIKLNELIRDDINIREVLTSMNSNIFIVKMIGNSMSPYYLDGDTIHFKICFSAESGQIVVAKMKYEEHPIIRKYIIENDYILLKQINPESGIAPVKIPLKNSNDLFIYGTAIRMTRDELL